MRRSAVKCGEPSVAPALANEMPSGPQMDKRNGGKSVMSKPLVGLPAAIGLTAVQTRASEHAPPVP